MGAVVIVKVALVHRELKWLDGVFVDVFEAIVLGQDDVSSGMNRSGYHGVTLADRWTAGGCHLEGPESSSEW